MQDLEKFKNEMNLSGKNVYVGHRYVPKIFGEWDKTKIYEPLSIVQYQGNSFTSRQYVPVGVEITNEEYWASTGNYNAQVEQYRQDVRNLENDVNNINNEVIIARDGETTLSARLDKDYEEITNKLEGPRINLAEKNVVWGTDATAQFIEAYNELPATGGTIYIPGNITLSEDIVIDKRVTIEGAGRGGVDASSGTTITLNGCSIRFNMFSSGARNINFHGGELQTGKGVLITSTGVLFEGVLVTEMASFGIKVGDEVNDLHANGLQLTNVRCIKNGGDGIWFVSKYGEIPNTNTMRLTGVVSSRNGGDGIKLDNTMDGKFLDISCEQNTGHGVHMVNGSGGHVFISPYMEWNSVNQRELYADDTCVNNMVIGNRRDSALQHFVFENPRNMMIGFDNLLGLFPIFQQLATRDLKISNPIPGNGNTGYWSGKMDAVTRELRLGIEAGADADIVLKNRLRTEEDIQLSSQGIRSTSNKAIRNFTYVTDSRTAVTIQPGGLDKVGKPVPGYDQTCTASTNGTLPNGIILTHEVQQDSFIFKYYNITNEPITFEPKSYATVFKTQHA